MGIDRGFDEKIDVIDLIINVLKDHENKLDELVSRLEEAQITSDVSIASQESSMPPQEFPKQIKIAVTAVLENWDEFAEKCSGAQLVAYNIADGFFETSAVTGGIVYIYREEIPRMDIQYSKEPKKVHIESLDISNIGLITAALSGKLDCGLKFTKRGVDVELPSGNTMHNIIYDIDPVIAKSWLAYQLGIDDSLVVQGKLQI
jgi:hypothetical protein